MASTFHGLETAKRGMYTQQSALYTTGHNIANANTPGFSRQRVNFVQTEPYPAAAMNRPQIPGQMGTGVEAGSVQRVREGFLDTQYRSENNKLGYWESRATALSKMEDIMNEPTENGLSAVMGEFWQSLQDLSVNPENEGARKVVLQRGQAVVDTFHYLSDSLNAIKTDFGNQVQVNLKEVNSVLKQISEVNKQISEIEPHGYLPNDLYDERDRLVDELSTHMNIKVEKVGSGGNALKIAEGIFNISMLDANGNSIGNLVTGSDYKQLGFSGTANKLSYDIPDVDGDTISDPISSLTLFDSAGETAISTISLTDANGTINFSQGKLRGLIESYGYSNPSGTITKGIYSEMLDDFDKLAFSFGNVFNEVHKLGKKLDGTAADQAFFGGLSGDPSNYKGAAGKITRLITQTKDIAASTNQAGDGRHAINLSNISSMLLANTAQPLEGITTTFNVNTHSVIKEGTLNSFYEGMVGKLGVDALQANRLTANSAVLRQSVEERKQSVSSVSLDEEMTNMIKFQHAYNAAARNITVVDEMLDKIINGMGTGGR